MSHGVPKSRCHNSQCAMSHGVPRSYCHNVSTSHGVSLSRCHSFTNVTQCANVPVTRTLTHPHAAYMESMRWQQRWFQWRKTCVCSFLCVQHRMHYIYMLCEIELSVFHIIVKNIYESRKTLFDIGTPHKTQLIYIFSYYSSIYGECTYRTTFWLAHEYIFYALFCVRGVINSEFSFHQSLL